MKFSLGATIAYLTWICVATGALAIEASWLRGIVGALAFTSVLIAFALIFTTPSKRCRTFCIGFSIVALGLILLDRLSIWDSSPFAFWLSTLFAGEWTGQNRSWVSGNQNLISLMMAHTCGVLGGFTISYLTFVTPNAAVMAEQPVEKMAGGVGDENRFSQ